MIKNKKFIIPAVSVFLLLELVLSVAIQHSHGNVNTALSYSAIVLAFLFSWLSFEHSVDFILTEIALFCTVMADLFLVVLDPMRQLPAMIFFSVTQLAYFTRILLKTKNKPLFITHITVRCVVSLVVVIITAIVLGDNCDAVALISLFYFANLILNVIFSFISFGKAPVLAIGLMLFLFCDFFVGMSMIGGYIAIGDGGLISFLISPGFNAAWLFYVPSQALIAVSVMSKKITK